MTDYAVSATNSAYRKGWASMSRSSVSRNKWFSGFRTGKEAPRRVRSSCHDVTD